MRKRDHRRKKEIFRIVTHFLLKTEINSRRSVINEFKSFFFVKITVLKCAFVTGTFSKAPARYTYTYRPQWRPRPTLASPLPWTLSLESLRIIYIQNYRTSERVRATIANIRSYMHAVGIGEVSSAKEMNYPLNSVVVRAKEMNHPIDSVVVLYIRIRRIIDSLNDTKQK